MPFEVDAVGPDWAPFGGDDIDENVMDVVLQVSV